MGYLRNFGASVIVVVDHPLNTIRATQLGWVGSSLRTDSSVKLAVGIAFDEYRQTVG